VLAWKTLPGGQSSAAPATGTKASPRRVIAPWPLLVAGFATMAAFVGMETTLAFLAAERFGAGPGFVGILLCLAGAALFLVQGLLVARASRRWGETRVALAGAVAMAAGLGVLPFAPLPFFVVAVVLLSAGDGLVTATVASMLAGAGPPGQRGARMGQSVTATARALGPLGSGVLFDVAAWLPYAVGAVLSAGVAVVVNLGRNAVTPASGPRAETTDRSNSQPDSG
jgi:hypothetical protein